MCMSEGKEVECVCVSEDEEGKDCVESDRGKNEERENGLEKEVQ